MPIDPKGRDVPGYGRHVFICGHERPEGATRPSCKNRGSMELLTRIKAAAREEGLRDIRIQKSGCLDFCENGIACVVYPEGTWYRLQPQLDVGSIVEHLKNGTVDTDLLMNLDELLQFYRPSSTTSLTLEHRCSILLDEVCIRSAALTAFDVCVHIPYDCFLEALRRNSSLESSTRTITRS